ncbi:MAG: hypothetical protein PHS06_01510 [Candidatus Shapirobacteria bacterium]|nr:hypothetical protein [Candidatus Shapirobacteria bacterium]
MKKVEEVGVVSTSDFGRVLTRTLGCYCSDINGKNQAVFFQENGKLSRFDKFNISGNYEKGIDLGGGSQLLLKGWVKVIKVAGHYPLLLQSDAFGFPHHLGSFGLKEYKDYYGQETIIERNMAGYIIDQERLICYEAEEIHFGGEDPKQFDCLGQKPMVLFNGKEEVGYIDSKRRCHLPSPKSKSKIHPMVDCWFGN